MKKTQTPPPTPQVANRMQREAISIAVKQASEAADAELAARLRLDIKGSPNDPLKAVIEKVIPGRVVSGAGGDGFRRETLISNTPGDPFSAPIQKPFGRERNPPKLPWADRKPGK